MTVVFKETFVNDFLHNLHDSSDANFNDSSNFKRKVDIGCAVKQFLQDKKRSHVIDII